MEIKTVSTTEAPRKEWARIAKEGLLVEERPALDLGNWVGSREPKGKAL